MKAAASAFDDQVISQRIGAKTGGDRDCKGRK